MALFVFISLFASIIGAISGIGGGLIIKPLLDAFSNLPVREINFLSGVTVLSMALFSCLFKLKNLRDINYNIVIFLVLGSVVGGLVGNLLLNSISSNLKLIQTISLLVINIMVLFYTLIKHKIRTYNHNNFLFITILGLALGTLSSFLGIGGGPMNIALLHYFFSFNMKIASANSLFIILLTQISSITSSILSQAVPNFDINLLVLMSFAGIVGAIIGQKISSKLTEQHSNHLFIILSITLILLNIYTITINLI